MKASLRIDVLLACMALAGIGHGALAQAAEVRDTTVRPLVPAPQTLTPAKGELYFRTVSVQAQGSAPKARQALDAALYALGIPTNGSGSGNGTGSATVRLQLIDDPALGEEGYRLVIGEDITLSARTDTGLLHAVQTLRQLLPARPQRELRLPRLSIADAPAYRWRGVSLDVARSFLPMAYLERHIDRMALFKLNRLHLHLTDDQGWRIQINGYPKLTEIGGGSAVEGGRAGFYTQDELKHLVAYAQARGVTIVPEIDMPGHVQAALASYNTLACDNVTNLAPYSGVEVGFSVLCLEKPEAIYPFVQAVLEQVVAIFPSTEIHIGGDEIKHPLYADFVSRAAAIVDGMGRTPIVWEEGSVATLKPNALLQLWNDGYDIAPAVAKGHPLILSPCSYLYVDHGNHAGQPGADWCRKEGLPLQRVYQFDPAPFKTAVGIEAALWTEFVHTDADTDARLWPRLAAVAELAWSPAGTRDYAGFVQRLDGLRPQLDALGVQYYAEPDLGWNAPAKHK
ncbi:family 20 glycosylhydrolase [Stenotrophomonas sp. 24(2023)]|uniref:beta-N-acetylhexosaminidase n=1 Tax=Stenotrophomonas sp. 24(2023) TaxID=3068324 RepID=UPI0027E0CBC0|nr:family 20 glycosylhydrolase [Stenotrophomonas sp. 24(2023)]WMJ69244.1 family 20 glycosylhydrolase [Stenotrophomonas sp. 24(2023)]